MLEPLPLELELERLPFGGTAIDELGEPLPAETLAYAGLRTPCCSGRSAGRDGTAAPSGPSKA